MSFKPPIPSILTLLALLVAGPFAAAQSDFVFEVPDHFGGQGLEVDLEVLLDNTSVDNIQGWSLGVCHDPNDLTILDAVHGATTEAFNDGDGPDLVFYNIIPFPDPGGPGWNVGVVISVLGLEVLPPGTGYPIHVATYGIKETDMEFTTMVCPCDEMVGKPATPLVVVIDGFSVAADPVCGELEVFTTEAFVRGDASGDGALDVGDGICILSYLFNSQSASCLDAFDTNNDGVIRSFS